MNELPKVLIIGDSISIGYTPYVADLLDGRFRVVHNAGNAADSNAMLVNIPWYLQAEPDAQLVHFNCGLHDIKRQRQVDHTQVPIAVYRKNLRSIVEHLTAWGKKLIWASSTPVIDQRHRQRKDFDRRNDDVVAYNAAAAEIVGAAGIPINDLYSVIERAGRDECLGQDGVHMTARGYELLGEAVARMVHNHMESRQR